MPVRKLLTKPVIKFPFSRASSSSLLPNPFTESTTREVNKCVTYTHSHPPSKLFFNQPKISYADLYSQLKSPSHLSEVTRLHALLIVSGFFNPANGDRQLGSQLVSVYVNFGCQLEALLVFDQLPSKSNNIAWNALLRGFVGMGEFSRVLEFYHLMLRRGLVPDNFTYPLVLKACSGLNNLEQGRIVRDHIVFNESRCNVRRNIYVDCAVIDMFAKCGSLKEARAVFDEMPDRDLASWSAMICGAVHGGEWFEALCLFKRMMFEGLQPDSVIVATVLPACGRLESKQMGMVLQGCSIRSGFESDLFVSNALIDMHCKCGDTHEARRIFCGMVSKDVVSWSTLISGYSQNSLFLESFELYLKSISAGIRTNQVLAAIVLSVLGELKLLKLGKEMHNYVLRRAFVSDDVVGSALVEMYANCRLMRQAEHVFKLMLDSGITVWNSVLVGYSLNGDIDSAFQISRRMFDFNLSPNFITLVSILPMCTKKGNVRMGKEIHGYATRSGLGTTVSVGNSIMDMYCKCGYLELGVKVFNHMMEKDVVTYNTIISALGVHGHGNEALSFLKRMEEEKIKPNKVTFGALLSACSHSGLVERGCFFYKLMMNDYHFQADVEHYSCMVDLLGRAGPLHDAWNFISRMPVEPSIDVLGSFLGACKLHNDVELAQVVGEHILQRNQKDPGHYVLLSNIYAYTHRWNDSMKFRKMIKDNGLVKKPGSSWIQIDSSIHMFQASSKAHPDYIKIQEALETLLLEMEDKGYMLDSDFS